MRERGKGRKGSLRQQTLDRVEGYFICFHQIQPDIVKRA